MISHFDTGYTRIRVPKCEKDRELFLDKKNSTHANIIRQFPPQEI